MGRISALLLLVLSVAGCQATIDRAAPAFGNADDGRAYIAILVDAIESSDRIVVVEHSSEYDAYDHNANRSLLVEDVVYASKVLDASQRSQFVAAIASLDTETEGAPAACIFEPHHTIKFYSGNELQSTMRICFRCGQVVWDGTRVREPQALHIGLATTIKGIGLNPDRDWKALAIEHLRARSN